MSLPKETKIRVLESFYAIDYILFGKQFKSIKLNENSGCSLCNQVLAEEYLSAKGALLGTVTEMYKLIKHNPPRLNEQINGKLLNKMAYKSAKIARKNASVLIKTSKGRNSVKNRLVETITENTKINIDKEVQKHIREKAYSLAIDNLLISRVITESKKYKEMNSWMGRIIEDAYKILRDSLIESAMNIKKDIISEQDEPQVQIGPVKKGELEVPEGKDVEDVSIEHFKDLIKKDGWDQVSKRIITLKVWNKNKDPKLANKMDDLQADLAKWVEDKRKENPDFAK
jgi:hypothetical protein